MAYSGFAATDRQATVKTWYWPDRDRQPNPRVKKSITIFNPISPNGQSLPIDTVYVPADVGNGDFFMTLADLCDRTGSNAQDAKAAEIALQNAWTFWNSSFNAWRSDGSLYVVPATIDGRPNPTPKSETRYDDKRVALMWSLITHKISEVHDTQFTFEARFWKPEVTNNTPYKIYFKVNSDEDAILQSVQDAVKIVLNKIDETSRLYEVIVTKSVENLGVNKIGHNFFNIYDTYMTDAEYTRMLNSVYTDRTVPGFNAAKDPLPIRPWPTPDTAATADALLRRVGRSREKISTTTIDLAKIQRTASQTREAPKRSQNRVMDYRAAREFASVFWPDAVYTNKKIGFKDAFFEWLHRVGHALGGQQVQKNLCFGTAEANTHMLRAESLILAIVKRYGWKGRLVTSANDDAHPTGTRLMWQVDPNPADHSGTPAFVQGSYVWAISFLEYYFYCDPAETKTSAGTELFSFSDEFDVFNRYVPLLLEYKVDQQTIPTVVQMLAPQTAITEKSTLYHDPYSIDQVTSALDTLDLNAQPGGRRRGPANPFSTSQFSSLLSRRRIEAMASSSLERKSTINLFGSAISVDIYKYIGTIPNDITPPPGIPALYEQAELSTLKLADFLPELSGTPFDSLSMRNGLFVYQNCQIDSTRPIGWSFSCDVTINKDIGSIHSVSNTLFGTEDFTVNVTGSFGNNANQTWENPLVVPSFVLTGTISSLSTVTIANGTFSSMGIHLHATRAHYNASAPATLDYHWDIFGQMAITLPGSSTASTFDFFLNEQDGYILIHGALQGNVWKDAVGVRGLDLQSVSFNICFELSKRPSTFDVEIEAQLELTSSVIDVNGMYSSSELTLSATWSSFYLSDLGELFQLLEGKTFKFPTVDVAIDTATLNVSNKAGVSVTLTDVIIDGVYDLEEASVSLGPSGVEIQAEYDGTVAICDSVTLDRVKIALSLGTGAQDSYLWFDGQISWSVFSNNLTFDVQVYFSSKSGKSAQYVVYGSVTGMNSWTFGNLLRDNCPSVLENVGLTSLSILVASANVTDTGPLSVPYDIREGVQICANIGEVKQVSGTLKKSGSDVVSGLRLYAHWPNPTFTVELPSSLTSACVDLGHDIKTGPVTFTIATSARAFLIGADLVYRPGSAGTELKFDFTLKLGSTSAAATLECQMHWNNPLGISSRLTITDIALGVDIDYAGLINVEMKGKFEIGNTSSNEIALVFGEDISDLLVKVDVNDIDVNDIIRLTSQILHTDLLCLPEGTIICKSFYLYACPKGVWLGSQYYSPGFSAALYLGIFGVSAHASLTIDTSSGFFGSASIENFTWSVSALSLWVTDASLEVKWTSSDKYVYAAGTASMDVAWWTVWVSVWIKITTSGVSGGIDLFSEAPAEMSSSDDTQTDVETIFTFPTFGSLPLHLTMRKNVEPTDWQNPMSGGPGVVFTFTGEFDSALLSHVTRQTRHHLEAMHSFSTAAAAPETVYGLFQDVLASLNVSNSDGSEAADPNDVANRCNQDLIAARNAREKRCQELRAEYQEYATKLERLVKARALAAERHGTAMHFAEQEQESLQRKKREIRAAEEEAKKAYVDKLKAAASDLVTHERYLRRQVGDPADELKDITDAIASISNDMTSVNGALHSLPSANLPWNISARIHLEHVSKELQQRRALLEASRTLASQRQREMNNNNGDPMYQRVREVEARIAALQIEEELMASSFVRQANTTSTAILDATSHLEWTRSQGDTLHRWRNAQQAVETHVASRSPFFDEHGRLVNLEQLPESVAREAAHRNLCLAIDATAGITSTKKTLHMFQEMDHQQRSDVIDAIDTLFRANPTNVIQLHEVTLEGKLDRPDDRMENLVLTAHATGKIGPHAFNYDVEMPIIDHHAFVHGLTKKLLADMF